MKPWQKTQPKLQKPPAKHLGNRVNKLASSLENQDPNKLPTARVAANRENPVSLQGNNLETQASKGLNKPPIVRAAANREKAHPASNREHRASREARGLQQRER